MRHVKSTQSKQTYHAVLVLHCFAACRSAGARRKCHKGGKLALLPHMLQQLLPGLPAEDDPAKLSGSSSLPHPADCSSSSHCPQTFVCLLSLRYVGRLETALAMSVGRSSSAHTEFLTLLMCHCLSSSHRLQLHPKPTYRSTDRMPVAGDKADHERQLARTRLQQKARPLWGQRPG